MEPVWYGLAAAAGAAIGFVVAILLTHSGNLETEKENVELRKNIKKLIETVAAKDRRILNLERTRSNQMMTIEDLMKKGKESLQRKETVRGKVGIWKSPPTEQAGFQSTGLGITQ